MMQQNLDWFRHYLLDEAREPVDGAWSTVEPSPNIDHTAAGGGLLGLQGFV